MQSGTMAAVLRTTLLLMSAHNVIWAATTSSPTADCPSGWLHSNGVCYGLVNAMRELTSTYDARQVCRSLGADLCDVMSAEFEDILKNLTVSPTYIGQNDIMTEGSFVYAEDTSVTSYTSDVQWLGGLPAVNNATGNGTTHCITLNNAGQWANVDCCTALGLSTVMCQKPNNTDVPVVAPDDDVFAKTCFEGIDDCNSSSCLNGATCNNHVLSFDCTCAPGYNGTQCEFDACDTIPCQNGGMCTLEDSGYKCNCGEWVNGDNCENVVSLCHSMPCVNNATCSGDTTAFNCTCMPGFKGTTCEININDCMNTTCVNGDCEDGIDMTTCHCHTGYTGETCDKEISCSGPMVANATSPNATKDVSYTYDAQLFFSCLDGHKFPDRMVNKTTRCTGKGWSPHLTACDLHCEYIPDVEHSSVLNGNTLVGTTVNYTCDVGYKFYDNSTQLSIQCVAPGNWSLPEDELPKCEVVTCSALPFYPHQDMDTRNNTYNTLITFWCDVGYELFDHTTARTIKCLADGEWTAELPPCEPVECPIIDLALIPGNTRNTSDYTYDNYVEYKCESGKRMVDGSTYRVVRCDATAEWSDDVTNCTENRCFPLPYVANATPNALDAYFETVVTLTCIKGHRFFIGGDKQEAMMMKCSGTSQRWAPILEACEPIICPNLTIPTKASLSTDNRLFDTTVNVTCDVGHYYNVTTMERVRWSQCMEDGQWDNVTTAPCISIPCPEAPKIYNGTTEGEGDGYKYADKILYTCGDGFKFVDGRLRKNITCTAIGNWDDTDMSCRKDRCDPVPQKLNTQPDTRNTSWETVVTFTCKPGHHWPADKFPNIKTQPQITCNLGTWANDTVSPCDPKVCPVIMKMPNATLNGTDVQADRLYNTQIQHSCDIGFKFPDNDTEKMRRCDEDGQWAPRDAVFPACEIILCPELEDVSNATRDSNETSYSTTVNYGCDQGYQYPDKENVKSIYCSENGTWTEYPPPCEVVFCPPLPLWSETNFNSTSNEFDAVVTYVCKDEFIFADFTYDADRKKVAEPEKTSMCMTDKTWEPPITDCLEIKGIADDLKGVVYESPNAQSIGTLAIALLTVVMALLVFLDANKLYTDGKVMRENVIYFMEKRRSRVSNNTNNIQISEVDNNQESAA